MNGRIKMINKSSPDEHKVNLELEPPGNQIGVEVLKYLIMHINKIIRIVEPPPRADTSAVCAINRHLRRVGSFCSSPSASMLQYLAIKRLVSRVYAALNY
jgi:hypothetical protein